jgi:hypothetical protein
LAAGAGQRAVLAGVLDFLCAHEPDLVAAPRRSTFPRKFWAAREKTDEPSAGDQRLAMKRCCTMVAPFKAWVDANHGVHFAPDQQFRRRDAPCR